MYGVDLISVLNKAKSNNEKYVAGTFVTGFTYGNEYLVNKNMSTNTKLVTGNYESEIKAGTYKLLAQDGKPQTSANVASLLNVADAISQSIKNTSKNAEKKLWYKEGIVEHCGWSSAEWRTALYDLKSKKFKCTDIKYNTDTGRIEYMKFEQI